MIDVAIINASTTATDDEVKKVIAAAQIQLDRDFSPVWGIYARLTFFTHKQAASGGIPAGYRWLSVLDDADQAGALGYHDLSPEGLPLGKVFWGTTKRAGMNPSITLTHELLELLADPEINLVVIIGEGKKAVAYAREVCDAPEDDRYAYAIGEVAVSDFVFPLWFVPGAPQGSKLDFLNRIPAPLALLPGGYIGIMKLSTGQWTQEEPTAEGEPGARAAVTRHAAQVHSRHERRARPRHTWRTSALVAA